MAKSAQQKMNEFFSESDETRAVVKAFSDAAFKNYEGFGYAAGYLESAFVGVVMQLPKAKREAIRREYAELAKRQMDQYLLKQIKEGA